MKRLLQNLLLVSLLLPALPQAVQAELITTESALATHQRSTSTARVNKFLLRADVQSELVKLGVEPQQALKRVDALTLSELTALENRINNLPAGGFVQVIGIVAIVFVILELVGVTNVFTNF